MTMIYDTHVHSTFSADGKSTVGEYAALLGYRPASAVHDPAGTLKHHETGNTRVAELCQDVPGGLGFAEHVDFLPECGSYGFLDPERYMREVREYRDKGLDFYAGGEIDYDEGVESEIIEHLKAHKYDYTICSVHMIDGISVSDRVCIPSVNDRKVLAGIVENYYLAVKRTINAGCFDVLGHLGVFKRYLDKTLMEDRIIKNIASEAESEIARQCAQSGMILEVNTSGLFSPLAETLPGKDFLKLYRSMGGRLVSVGSDAHSADNAGKGIRAAYDMLRDEGFDYVTLPWDKEHPVKIEQPA